MEFSPLDSVHRALGAKIVPFGGWDMPLEYGDGTIAEHTACRTDAVVFDVSHLGTVRVGGDGAFDLLQSVLTNDLNKIAPGRAQYTHLLDEADASVLDDIIVWWHPERDGPAPRSTSCRTLPTPTGSWRPSGEWRPRTARAVLAVQGPNAAERLATVFPDAAAIGRFRVGYADWKGVECTVAGTGYTGEQGLEIAVPADVAADLWEAIIGAGIKPAGLGARDTLRLEAALPLHGHELGPGITPLQAGLGWVVAWKKDRLPRPRRARRRTGQRDRPPARRHRHRGSPSAAGRVRHRDRRRDRSARSRRATSRRRSVTASRWDSSRRRSRVGTAVGIDVRGTLLAGTVVETPFVTAPKPS